VALEAAGKFKTFMHFLMRFKRVGLVNVLVFPFPLPFSIPLAPAAAKVQSVLIMPFICNLNESVFFFCFLNKYMCIFFLNSTPFRVSN